MKKIAFISCIVCILFLSNCKKEDSNNQNNPTDTTGTNNTFDDLQIESLISYDGNNIEKSSQIFEFDAQGRKISFESYIDGELVTKYRNFVYNGLHCTYFIDMYNNGSVISTNKYEITYTDNTYKKYTSAIMYNSDNTEFYSYIYDYNSNGVEIGFSYSYLGELSQQHRDYVIQGTDVTYFSDTFVNGSVSASQKFKVAYNTGFKQLTSVTQYNSDNTEFTRNEFEYNSSGNLIGTSFYLNGALSSQNRDYSYNGKVQTFYTDNYSNGVILSSYKNVVTYH